MGWLSRVVMTICISKTRSWWQLDGWTGRLAGHLGQSGRQPGHADLTGKCYFGAETWISYGRFAGLLSGSVVSSQVRRAPRGSCCSRPWPALCYCLCSQLWAACACVCLFVMQLQVPRMGYIAASQTSSSTSYLGRHWADVKISPRVFSKTATIKPERGDVMQQLELTRVLIRPYP